MDISVVLSTQPVLDVHTAPSKTVTTKTQANSLANSWQQATCETAVSRSNTAIRWPKLNSLCRILNLGLCSCLVVGFQYVKFKNLADILNAIWNIPYEFKNQGKCYCKRGPAVQRNLQGEIRDHSNYIWEIREHIQLPNYSIDLTNVPRSF